jgi:hypothetical protein
MSAPPNDHVSNNERPGLPAQATAALRFTARLPFKIAGRIAQHTIQVIFAIFVVILHPQAKWLFHLIADSTLVRNYIRPSLQTFSETVYEPYFAYLAGLSPFWATFSIALPLTILEPAKTYATILVAEHPKSGIVLYLVLQGLSVVLIDRTWKAVRPQSRKIRLVATIHAWGWLTVTRGKYWIENSALYRTARVWKRQARRSVRSLWASLVPQRRKTP